MNQKKKLTMKYQMEEVHPFPNPMFEIKYCKFITFGNQVSERDRMAQGLKIAALGCIAFWVTQIRDLLHGILGGESK